MKEKRSKEADAPDSDDESVNSEDFNEAIKVNVDDKDLDFASNIENIDEDENDEDEDEDQEEDDEDLRHIEVFLDIYVNPVTLLQQQTYHVRFQEGHVELYRFVVSCVEISDFKVFEFDVFICL